jgi:hypothetical protein
MPSMFHAMDNVEETKNNSPQREIVLKPIDGKATDSRGMVDSRLFKGDNKLKAIMDENGLWYCKFDQGILPESLKVKFTSVPKLVKFVTEYYKKRSVEVVEVKNAS